MTTEMVKQGQTFEGIAQGQFWASFSPDTVEQQKMLFNGMNNPTSQLSDVVDKTINLVDVFVEWVQLDESDEVSPRIVLFDDEGNSYVATSKGILIALNRAFLVFGEPKTWAKPLPITIRKVKVARGHMLTFDAAL